MMELIIGLDPGLNSCGIAVASFTEVLAVGRVRVKAASKRLPLGERVMAMCAELDDWLCHTMLDLYDGAMQSETTLVYEWPQIYGVGKAKGDPNDLPALAAVGAAFSARICPEHIETPKPREWQGGTKKSTKGNPWASSRGAQLAKRLTVSERKRVPDSHDAIDAACLALHPTTRALAKPTRVYPGATR